MKIQSAYRKLGRVRGVLALAVASSAFLMPFEMLGEVKKLVTDAKQLSASTSMDNRPVSNLLSEGINEDSSFHTHDDIENHTDDVISTFKGEQYLQVDLASPLNLGDKEDLMVFVQRCHCLQRQPTAFRVEGQMADSVTWEPICNLYFLYRGQRTKEYSSRFHPNKGYSKLRFYVTENNSRNHDGQGYASMGMAQFQLYQLGRTDTVDNRIDPVHLKSDYKKDYKNYTFVRTMGWLDARNRSEAKTKDNLPTFAYDEKAQASIKGKEEWQKTYIENINKWAKWEEDWDNSGKWNKVIDKLKDFRITMPDMELILEDADFNSSTSPNDLYRQPTHESEHILYAVPGDPIILYPYYKFAESLHYEKYEVNFAHWYDYRTGGRIIHDDGNGNKMDLLDFIADPSNVCITDKNGFYGGYLLTDKSDNHSGQNSTNYGMFATFYCPRSTEIGDTLTLPFRSMDTASGINDEDEFVIAADFSQSFNRGRNILGDTIIEPEIAFRHIFRIRDGKKFAEEFSGSETANEKYIETHTRRVTARANADFQIGLEGAVPRPEKKDWGWWRSVPSKYYYKVKDKHKETDNDYRRIESMAIRVTDPNGNEKTYSHKNGDGDPFDSGNWFYFDSDEKSTFTGLGSRRIDNAYYGIAGGGVADEGIRYSRFLKGGPKESGKYIVEILGEEIVGHDDPTIIKVYGSDQDLVVMRYEIEFVDESQAFLTKVSNLYSKNSENSKYEFAREEELIKKYGEPKDKVDFDQYRYLETLDNWEEYLNGEKKADNTGEYSFKWPVAWGTSNYGFGYADGHDYNMYVIANSNSKLKWKYPQYDIKDLLSWKNDNLTSTSKSDPATRADEETASRPLSKDGYFLYVNAANDPGVMVTLNAGTLCTGSTINVTACVIEMSNETEKANLAFNLVAVLAGTGERINVHSFVSGYVKDSGDWYKIFYSFQPDVDKIGYTSAQIDHYELELENNCKSSVGADYAIDEIAIYIVTPVIGAEQVVPVCWDLYKDETKDIDKKVKLYAPFNETLRSMGLSETKTGEENTEIKLFYLILDRQKYEEEYEKAQKGNSDDPETAAIAASRIQEGAVNFNTCFDGISDYKEEEDGQVGRYTDERGTKMIAFNVEFDDENYAIGKEYYIAMYTQADGENYSPTYDLHDPCSKTCTFIVAGKNDVKLNGTVVTKSSQLKVCEGEEAKITVDVKTEGNRVETDARCDWFKGTNEQLNEIDSLYKAMVYFRDEYPEVDGPEHESVVARNLFSQKLLDIIKKNKDKFEFSKDNYEFGILTKGKHVVTALPIPFTTEGNEVVCTAPMEINVEVESPYVLHGLRDVEYPDSLTDVPLRAGLDQLKHKVIIPLRKVVGSGVVKDVTSMNKTGDVMLESTTDPNPDFKSEIMTSSSGEKYTVKPDIKAGEITRFDANLEDGSKNEFTVEFDSSFQFREGYEYTFSYEFEEDMPSTVAEGDIKHVCKGKDLFTIKVVPEFLVWTPSEGNRNWNNDGNWQRISSDRLLADKNAEGVTDRIKDKVTDVGNNENTGAYMPMDFTKVIIPATTASAKAPFMYKFEGLDSEIETVVPAQSGVPTDLIEYDMVAKDGASYVECDRWYANTCKEIHFEPEASIMNQQYLTYEKAWVDLELNPYRWYTLAMPLKKVFAGEFYLPSANARQETELFQPIKYDPKKNNRFNPAVFQRGWDKGKADIYHTDGRTSSAVVKANWSHVYNDVEESYGSGVGFSIKADISGISDDPNNAPTKVLFRLPKADTEYGYYDVKGDDHNLDYKTIDHGTDHYKLNPKNGTIIATTAGNGKKYFLVGNPFMTHLDMAKFLKENEDQIQQKYWMITAGTQKMGVFDPDSSDGLVGNGTGHVAPMQGFFVEVKDNVEIVGNTLSLKYNESMMYDVASLTEIAPLKVASRGYDEGFTLTISAINDDEESTAAVVKVSADASHDYFAEEDMVVLDNSDLEVRATVYTVSDGKALSVNSLDGIDNVELGLIALPEEETMLRFNIDEEYALCLYDVETGAYIPIFDGMTYPVSGNVSGRLYLTSTSGVKTPDASKISWSASGDVLTVRSSDSECSHLSVRIIDYAGRVIAAQSTDGCEVSLPIASGVYVLEAETESERLCIQVKL